METARAVKILHCADFHFDSPFRELSGAMGEKRKEDLRETFGRIVKLVQTEKVQLLLLCGDLFDQQRVSRMTIDYLIHKFREIADVHVFLAPGNHDPYYEKSYYHLVQWPENVHIFKEDTWARVDLEELKVCVYGRGFGRAHQQQSLLKGFRVDDVQKLNIMLLHGDVVSPGQSSDYNPLTAAEISASGLDYLALGHRHTVSEIAQAGQTFWAYSGCPEGRAFDELGEKGVLLGELSKGSCRVTFRKTGKREYFERKIDLSGCQTYEQIAAAILAEVKNCAPQQNLFKITLQGEPAEDFGLYPAVISEKLAPHFYYLKLVDQTTTKVDYHLLAADFTLKGLFVKKMRQIIQQAAEEPKPKDREKSEPKDGEETKHKDGEETKPKDSAALINVSGQINQTRQLNEQSQGSEHSEQHEEAAQFTEREEYAQKEEGGNSKSGEREQKRRKAELALKYGLRILEQGEAGIE